LRPLGRNVVLMAPILGAASGRHEFVQICCQKRNVPTGAVFKHELKSAGSATPELLAAKN